MSDDFVSVSRCIHLTGGLRAGTSKNGKLIIHPMGTPSVKVPIVTIDISEQGKYVGYFRSLGLEMVGFENIHTDDCGFTHAAWTAWDPNANSVQTDLNVIWSGIRNSYQMAGDTLGEVLASNLSFGFRAAASHLRNISNAYTNQNVISLCHNYAHGCFFKNPDTINVFLTLHSFLVEMGVLRDHIARLIAEKRFCLSDVSTMSTLYKHCKKIERDPVAAEIVKICDKSSPDGWMAQLSCLRDQVVHVAPIQSQVDFSAVVATKCTVETIELPTVYLGLQLSKQPKKEVDALVHSVALFRRMADFGRMVANHLGVKPQMVTFAGDELVEAR